MVRLGIIGAESSHVDGFLHAIRQREDVALHAIWGENAAAKEKIANALQLECEVDSPADMVGKVDAVLVTLRDGAKHLEAVRPLIGQNIAVWMDKPFAVSVSDAKELLQLLTDSHTIFSGGSSVKLASELKTAQQKFRQMGKDCLSGYLAYQTMLESPYSGMHFYSHHLIESALLVFGCNVRSVFAKRSGESLSVIAAYDTFHLLLNYGVAVQPLHVGVFGKSESFLSEYDADIKLSQSLDEFLTAIANKQSPYPPEFFLTAVKLCNAIIQSMEQRREVVLEEV